MKIIRKANVVSLSWLTPGLWTRSKSWLMSRFKNRSWSRSWAISGTIIWSLSYSWSRNKL